MKSSRVAPSPSATAPATFAVALLLLAPGARAQSGGGHPPRAPTVPPTPAREARPPSIREREIIMGEMEREAAKPAGEKRPELPLEQIAEDFERIQVVHNRMMGAVMRTESPDYGLISAATAEVRKRAARLRSNLQLPEPDKKEAGKGPEYRRPEDAAQMKAALLRLDRALMSFVKNPAFKNPDVVDAADGAKARRDLEEVIELSRLIGKDAERLSKGAGKP
jgi:hypothetical protein